MVACIYIYTYMSLSTRLEKKLSFGKAELGVSNTEMNVRVTTISTQSEDSGVRFAKKKALSLSAVK